MDSLEADERGRPIAPAMSIRDPFAGSSTITGGRIPHLGASGVGLDAPTLEPAITTCYGLFGGRRSNRLARSWRNTGSR